MTFNGIKNWFRHSETILWARIQILVGAIWTVAIATDLSPILNNPKYLTAWTLFSGIVTEYARRRGTETVTTTVAAPPSAVDQTPVVVKMLSDTPPPVGASR